MKFYDKVKITVEAGKGGDGIVAGRREKFIPFGGPAGGDGGKGGDIILISSKDENTLLPYRYKSYFKAENGENGKGHDMYGKKGEDLILKVPVGTIVKDAKTGKVLYQFKKDGERFVVAKGGRGGYGNIHFKSPTRQFPNFALLGEPGEKRELILELQMLGDVALIGFPSVGKSTLINAITNVKAKVADYPFTTLIPNLGVVNYKNYSFSIVDVPGLIRGASEGKGLGFDFLRHILKAKVWTFIFDVSRYEEGIKEIEDLIEEIFKYLEYKFLIEDKNFFGKPLEKINYSFKCEKDRIIFECKGKFENFNEETLLFQKVIVFLFNKIDVVQDEEILDELENKFLEDISKKIFLTKDCIKSNIVKISAAGRINLDKFLDLIISILQKENLIGKFDFIEKVAVSSDKEEIVYVKDVTDEEIDFLIKNGYIEEKDAKYIKVWEVYHPYLCYLTFVLPWGNDEAELWFWEELNKKGIMKWLEKYGVRKGDILKVKSIYGGYKDRYILVD